MAVLLSWLLVAATAVQASGLVPRTSPSDPLASCHGYKASNIKTTGSSLTADLSLAGAPCNVYGDDLKSLTLEVVYETGKHPLLTSIQQLTKSTQMTASTSRSKILPTACIKCPPASCHDHLHLQESSPKILTSNSNMLPRRSRSRLLESRLEKCFSILQLQVSFSRLSTSD
jgi:hypothetical protein